MPDQTNTGAENGLDRAAPSSEGLFDLVPSAISIQDRHFRIRRVNKKFRELFGNAVVGRECFVAYKGRSEVCLDCPMAKTFDDGQSHRSEEVVRTLDGNMIQMAVETAPILDDSGEVIGGMEVATDISRTVASQQEMVLLGRAMAGMAHYIKNIVTGLEGGIFVVEEGMANGSEEMLHEGWDMVRRNIKRVTKLSHDQLFCSRERPVEMRDVRPNALVCDAVRLYHERATQFGVELQVELDPRIGVVRLDPDGFHNLLTNLLSNAVDACVFDTGKERHWVSVKTHLDSSGELFLEVADNGQGISSELCGEVFTEMFSSKGRAGTGLGLLVIYRVVCAHGGQVTVLSDEGVGTVFTVILPVSSPSPVSPA